MFFDKEVMYVFLKTMLKNFQKTNIFLMCIKNTDMHEYHVFITVIPDYNQYKV